MKEKLDPGDFRKSKLEPALATAIENLKTDQDKIGSRRKGCKNKN